MSVREYVFTLVANDPEMNGLGYSAANGFTEWAPDSPPAGQFWVLRWGPEVPGLAGARGRGRISSRDVTLWAYDRQQTYDTINACLRRWVALMDSVEATRTGMGATDGWITSTEWAGDGDDSFDDVYNAQVRSSSYTIVASGD